VEDEDAHSREQIADEVPPGDPDDLG
jgi:hypothetical protein